MKNQTPFWKGARIGFFLFLCFASAFGWYHWRTGIHPGLMALIGLIAGGLSFLVFEFIGKQMKIALDKIPMYTFAAIIGLIGSFLLLKNYVIRLPSTPYFLTIVFGGLAQALMFGGLLAIIRGTQPKRNFIIALLLGIILNVFGLYYWMHAGEDPYPIESGGVYYADLQSHIFDPGEKGVFEFDYFTYGSKNSNRRDIFNEQVRYQTKTIDASLILPEWKGKKAKWRQRFWGFGVDSFPLNAHVWMPKGEGPFPLILIVHGNHGMEHYSDPGYAYLGEHLASRGYITLSIDENFVNGTWSGDFRGREMPARAWILLKHLEKWRVWSQHHPDFKGKVNMDNILLVGHSRGGEAVAIAAVYNTLSHFPDNALVEFDFNFGIKGLVTIAPTDKRYFRRLELQDINYLTLQGSYDSDEASFFGNRLGNRILYSDKGNMINAGIVIHRANHGQFNSIWGKRDFGRPFGFLLNTGALISTEDQQKVAKVSIAAFAEAICKENDSYQNSFRNFEELEVYLPPNIYLNTFRNNRQIVINDYENDVNVRTGSLSGSQLLTKGMTVWKEEKLQYRDKDFQHNQAVVLGWNHQDTLIESAQKPLYEIHFPSHSKLDSSMIYLRFDISLGDEDALKLNRKDSKKDVHKEDIDWTETDFSIHLVDSTEKSHSLIFSDHHKLSPRLKIGFMKSKTLSKEMLGTVWEPVLSSKYISLDKFEPPIQNVKSIEKIQFIFNQSQAGIVILDNIGFSP